MVFPDPAPFLAMLVAEPLLFFMAVVLMSFLLEDATALAAGALAGQMQVDPALALSAVIAGTVAGDFLLHGMGRLALRWPVAERRVARAGRLVSIGRSPALVAAARFVPGLRLPAYAGSGLAGMSPLVFGAIVLATGLVWTPLLFGAGRLVMDAQGGLVLALLVGVLALLPGLLKQPLQRFAMARSR